MTIQADELLGILADERRRSVGFEHDDELAAARETALKYYKGEMTDMPSQPNRSRAVSTDVSDAIETLLPDLVEIFTGGDDVATFIPRGQEDEEAAQQETDYVNHVVFNENDGWMTFYTMFKDALQVKTGLVTFYWEDYDPEEETLEGKTMQDLLAAQQDGEITDVQPNPENPDLIDITISRKPAGRLCIEPIAPEDFTTARDTVKLKDATYCAYRSRPRAQDLIIQGIDPEIVASLPAYDTGRDEAIDQARDTAGENDRSNGGLGDLRAVEVITHFIRMETEGKLELHKVLTGGGETILISQEVVDSVPIAAITPYIVTHRFYGESVADHMMEVQKIRTAITRGYLDNMYFSLNQRIEVGMDQANQFTLTDLLQNEPGRPVRSKTGNALKQISAGGTNFDALSALEYFATVGEQRSGVVRAAQGLTPDTLHETAKGALALLGQAQKRVRLIARIFAETGVKDLFLGVHALLRKHGTQQATVRLRGKWINIAPTNWGVRSDMSIEIGLGSSGKEAELMAIQQQIGMVTQLAPTPFGRMFTEDNVYNLAKRFFERTGAKAPERFVTDPKTLGPPAPPPPDPKVLESQAKLQLQQAEGQAKLQMEGQKAQAEMQGQQMRSQSEAALRREEMMLNAQIKREQIEAELALKREQLQAELAMKRELGMYQADVAASARINSAVSQVRPGGEAG